MTEKVKKLYHDPNLQIVFAITLMAVLGVSSITPAFPGIRKNFDITTEQVGLLVTFFTLPGVFLAAFFGVLADRFGRKLILVPALLLFGLAGGTCFFLRDFTLLVFFRFLQGIGAASLGAINLTVIGDLFSGKDRSAAMGYNGSVLSVGTASYPLLGGALATIGWNYPFLLPFLGVGVGLLVLFGLKNPEPKKEQTLKSYFQETFTYITKKQIIGLFILSIFTFIILYGPYLTYIPFLVGEEFGQPPYIIGIIMASASVATMFTSWNMGKISRKFNEVTLIKGACGFYFLSMILIPFIPNVWLLLIPTVLFGMAQGINLPSLLSVLSGMAPMRLRGAIMSVNGMVLRLGQTLGPLVVAPVYAVWGISGAYVVGAFTAVAMFFIVLIFIAQDKIDANNEE